MVVKVGLPSLRPVRTQIMAMKVVAFVVILVDQQSGAAASLVWCRFQIFGWMSTLVLFATLDVVPNLEFCCTLDFVYGTSIAE